MYQSNDERRDLRRAGIDPDDAHIVDLSTPEPPDVFRVQIRTEDGVFYKADYDPASGLIRSRSGVWRRIDADETITHYRLLTSKRWEPWGA